MLTETIVHKIQVKEFAKPFVAQVTAVIPMGINFGVSPRQGGRSKLGVRSYGWLAASQKFPRARTWNLNDLLGDDEATIASDLSSLWAIRVATFLQNGERSQKLRSSFPGEGPFSIEGVQVVFMTMMT